MGSTIKSHRGARTLGTTAATHPSIREIVESIVRDVRHACRLLIAQPGWTVAAILCLAIATGANTAAFSVINGLPLRPLPFKDPGQLVMVALKESARAHTRPFSLAEYRDLASRADAFAALLARTFLPVSLASDQGAAMVEAELVSGNYFEMLMVVPFAGRFFDVAADRACGSLQAVISHDLWRRRFAGDASAVGGVVRVNGRTATVIGVAPAGFVGATQLIATDLWVPAACHRALSGKNAGPDLERTPMFGVMGRMKPDVTLERARAQLNLIETGLARDRGADNPPAVVAQTASGFGVPPIARDAVANASVLLFGLMALLVAVAGANVASLVLARAAGRHREIGVRLALGASTPRIVRQLMTESTVLAVLGGAAGTVLAVWVTHLFGHGPRFFQYVAFAVDIRPDWRVLAYAIVAALATAVVFGLVPARHAVRTDLVEVLKRSGASGRTPAALRTIACVVVGQIAVSTALLVATGLLVRTYLNAHAVDPGIETARVLSVSLDLDQLDYDPSAGGRFYEELLAQTDAMPGVEVGSLTSDAPLSLASRDARIWIDGTNNDEPSGPYAAGSLIVTAEYFKTLHIPLKQGRSFAAVTAARPLVAIVNETMARRFWPHASPLGRSFRVRGVSDDRLEVIGVVRDVKNRALNETPRAVFYQPFVQRYSPRMTLLVRAWADPRALIEPIESAIRAKNYDLAIVDVRTLDERLDAAVAPWRQSVFLLSIVGVLGLLLSSVGLYGVISYGVRERARELGIRLALGASGRDLAWMVLGRGCRMTLLGLVIGVGASLALTRLGASMLYGVTTHDPITLAVVCGALLVVAVLASLLPARWAARVDPMLTLRRE